MSVWAKLGVLVVAVLALLAGLWKVYHTGYLAAQTQGKLELQALELQYKIKVEEQQHLERDLQRAAELKYIVQEPVREKYITQTVKEIAYVTTNLAQCTLTQPAIQLLNAASSCASEDRAASCQSH